MSAVARGAWEWETFSGNDLHLQESNNHRSWPLTGGSVEIMKRSSRYAAAGSVATSTVTVSAGNAAPGSGAGAAAEIGEGAAERLKSTKHGGRRQTDHPPSRKLSINTPNHTRLLATAINVS